MAVRGNAVKSCSNFRILGPIEAIAKQHGAFQHVAGAKRSPGIANAIGATADIDTELAQKGDRRQGNACGCRRHQRDLQIGETPPQCLDLRRWYHTPTIYVTDHDFAAKAAGGGKVGDAIDLPQSQLTCIVEMNVDAAAMLGGEIENSP